MTDVTAIDILVELDATALARAAAENNSCERRLRRDSRLTTATGLTSRCSSASPGPRISTLQSSSLGITGRRESFSKFGRRQPDDLRPFRHMRMRAIFLPGFLTGLVTIWMRAT